MTKSELNPCHVITTMNKLLFRTLEKANTVCLNLKEEAQKKQHKYYELLPDMMNNFMISILLSLSYYL